ncbi:MAG: penicillin-binding protein 2 [Syntrophales bacterium]|nr:penicillin-binding protein 2 [Syntrophales bacterium]
MNGRLNAPERQDYRGRLTVIFALVMVAALVIIGRLFYLQVIKGDEYRLRSENNSVRLRKIKPVRGVIYDVNRHVMADSEPSFDLNYLPKKRENIKPIMDKVEAIYQRYGITPQFEIVPTGNLQPFVPIRLERNVSWEKVAIIETHILELPGVTIEPTAIRSYKEGEMVGHIVGYIGEVTQQELEHKDWANCRIGDIVGKSGIERAYDIHLRGISGAEQVEVNAVGKVVRSLGRIEPIPGNNVVLTINLDVQRAAWNALQGRRGAVVAVDVRDGSILALVSSPSFDPNLFCAGIRAKEWQKLAGNPWHPLKNRAVSGQYPPGSTYKPFVALAALEEKVVDDSTRFFCSGAFQLGTRAYRCWQKNGHGWVNIHRAIVESCDVYFYNLGKILGVDRIAKYAKMFGLGEPTGIDLPWEKGGLIPTRQWKWERLKKPWHVGESIPIAIGQGYDLATPLQLAVAYAAIANGGIVYRPRIVKQIEEPDGRIVKNFAPEIKGRVSISTNSFSIIKKGLWGVVNEGGGTGYAARRPEKDVAGKTGTAQVVSQPERGRTVPARFQDHALFVCFVPYEHPEVAVSVVVEHAGHGGAVAAPVAKAVIDAYMESKKSRNRE